MAKKDNFLEKHRNKINLAGHAINTLQNQKIQENQKVLGRLQAANLQLHKERNDLLKKELENNRQRKEKQYELLKLAPQLKNYINELFEDDSIDGKEVGLRIELAKLIFQYLQEHDQFVEDINYHEFLLTIAPQIEKLGDQFEAEVDAYYTMMEELNFSINEVSTLIDIFDELKEVDYKKLYEGKFNHLKLWEKCQLLQKNYSKIEKLIHQLESFIEFDAEGKLSTVNGINVSLTQSLVPLPSKEAKSIKEKLTSLPKKEWVENKCEELKNQAEEIDEVHRIENQTEKPSYLLNDFIKDYEKLSSDAHEILSPIVSTKIDKFKSVIESFQYERSPGSFVKLRESIGHHYFSYQMESQFEQSYNLSQGRKRINTTFFTLILLFIANFSMHVTGAVDPVVYIFVNSFYLFIYIFFFLSMEPYEKDIAEHLELILSRCEEINSSIAKVKERL